MTYNNIIELKCDQKSSIIQYQYDHLIKNGDTAHILGYRRCSEFDLNNQPGQDFAVMRRDDTYVVGIVADGVSQSFYGNLAAEWVSLFLINKLWDNRRDCLSQSDLEQMLRDFEKEKSISVKNFSIPTNLSTGVQKALAIKQQKDGSQTVFGAFVLNVEKKSACLYQVGDITFIVHYSTGDFQQIYGHPDGRWSSEGKSDFRLKIIELNNIAGIIIKSDGVSEGWGKSLNPKDICRGQFKALATKDCRKDDVSFIASIFCTKEDISLFDVDEIDCNKPANLQINSKSMDTLRDNKLGILPPYNSLEKPQISTKIYNKEQSSIVFQEQSIKHQKPNINQKVNNLSTDDRYALWQYISLCAALIVTSAGIVLDMDFLAIVGCLLAVILLTYILISFVIRKLYKIISIVLSYSIYFVKLLFGINARKQKQKKDR